MIVESMLTEVRTNAGLGNPPTPFYTNVPESANAVIKRAVNFEESEMASFALKLAQLIKRQREDVRGVLLNNGPYKLIDDYTASPADEGKVVFYVFHPTYCPRK